MDLRRLATPANVERAIGYGMVALRCALVLWAVLRLVDAYNDFGLRIAYFRSSYYDLLDFDLPGFRLEVRQEALSAYGWALVPLWMAAALLWLERIGRHLGPRP